MAGTGNSPHEDQHTLSIKEYFAAGCRATQVAHLVTVFPALQAVSTQPHEDLSCQDSCAYGIQGLGEKEGKGQYSPGLWAPLEPG